MINSWIFDKFTESVVNRKKKRFVQNFQNKMKLLFEKSDKKTTSNYSAKVFIQQSILKRS